MSAEPSGNLIEAAEKIAVAATEKVNVGSIPGWGLFIIALLAGLTGLVRVIIPWWKNNLDDGAASRLADRQEIALLRVEIKDLREDHQAEIKEIKAEHHAEIVLLQSQVRELFAEVLALQKQRIQEQQSTARLVPATTYAPEARAATERLSNATDGASDE